MWALSFISIFVADHWNIAMHLCFMQNKYQAHLRKAQACADFSNAGTVVGRVFHGILMCLKNTSQGNVT